MQNIATSVRITPKANRAAATLASRMGASKAQVIEMALLTLEEKLFWREVHAAYAEIADDPEQLAELRKEISAWDHTLSDGLSAPTRKGRR